MPEYEVGIQATIIKTLLVEADSENDAYVEAHEIFSVLSDGTPENYDETTLFVREVLP